MPAPDPHAWDLCEHHASHITAPVGWELVRVEEVDITDDEQLRPRLAEPFATIIRESGSTADGDDSGAEHEHEGRNDLREHTTSFDVACSRKTLWVEARGLEPLTPCLQSRCATNCAMPP